MSTTNPPRQRRPLGLLALGAAAGVALAASGLVGSKPNDGLSVPQGAAAQVNGQIIRTEDYERTLAGLAGDRRDGRDGIDAEQRRHLLDRLIDEELLVQRAIELGLARRDRKVRADLTAAVIASIVAESEDVQPTPAQLQAFYDESRAFFTRPGRLRLRQVFVRPGDEAGARERAAEASRRLRAGDAFGPVRDALGDPEISPLPDTLMPAEKLIDYLGPTALKAALGLAAGEVSEPVRSGTGYHVLQVVERQTDVTPTLAEIEPQVVAEFRRRAGDQALRAYLDDLRRRANVAVDPNLQ